MLQQEKIQRIIESLSVKYLSLYQGRGLERSDLIQEGWEGALRAEKLYKPAHTSKARFSTYAYWFIRGRISKWCKVNHCLYDTPTESLSSPESEVPYLDTSEVNDLFNLSTRPDLMRFKYYGDPLQGGTPSKNVIYYHHVKMLKEIRKRFNLKCP